MMPKAATSRRRPAKRMVRRAKRRVSLKWRKPRKANGRKNPAQGAKAMFERFHGRASSKSVDYKQAQHFHEHLAELGDLVSLKVLMPEWHEDEAMLLTFKGVKACCSEDGGQIYFVGGDQRLNLNKLGLADTLPKDHVVIGPLLDLVYFTAKKFDGFKPFEYEHAMGEEGGELPTLLYDVRSELFYLAGGSYQCLQPGIVN